ncbi:MAG: crossover junction endodeoxyribonuclease RuvC [Bacteroidota bacterium]
MAAERYKILGVDPGTNITGYGIIERQGRDMKLVTMGVFDLRKCKDHQTKLKEIFLQLQEVIETYLPKHLAIEAPFYGKNVQSMLKLGRAQGVAMAAAMTMGLRINEYAPKKIKVAITGSGNASKEQVAAMIKSRMQITLDDRFLDATDAVAAAICHSQQLDGSFSGADQVKYKDWKSYLAANQSRLGS